MRAVAVFERPLPGPDVFGVAELLGWRDEILKALDELLGSGGTVLLPFVPEEERSVCLTLGAVLGELRRRGEPVPAVERPLAEFFARRTAVAGDRILFHHAPRHPGIERRVEDLAGQGKALLLTGLAEELERIDLRAPQKWLRKPVVRQPPRVQTLPPTGAGNPHVRWVAACDLWGVPLPLGLLADVSRESEEVTGASVEALTQSGPLFWLEATDPRGLFVATGGEEAAAELLEAEPLRGEPLAGLYRSILETARADEASDRHTALRLLQAWLVAPVQRHARLGSAGKIGALRPLARAEGVRLSQGARASPERLAWGLLLADYRLYPESVRVLSNAVAADPENVFLAHAHAHALGRWAEVEPDRAEEAREAFRRAARAAPRSPYVWQAWGVMEQRLGNARAARNLFDSALRVAPGNVAAVVGRADLALDEGQYDEAAKLLNRGERIDPQSPFVLHLSGRLAYCRGEYARARERFEKLLALEPGSAHALHGLGLAAAAEGDLGSAAARFGEILAADPENAAALHSLAELRRRAGEQHAAAGQTAEARDAYAEAERLLSRALEAEPENPRLVTGSAVLELKQAEAEDRPEEREAHLTKAHAWIQGLLSRWPESAAPQHLAGSLAEARGDAGEARRRYRAALERSPQNLHALFSLAELAVRLGELGAAREGVTGCRIALNAVRSRLPAHERAGWEARLSELEKKIPQG